MDCAVRLQPVCWPDERATRAQRHTRHGACAVADERDRSCYAAAAVLTDAAAPRQREAHRPADAHTHMRRRGLCIRSLVGVDGAACGVLGGPSRSEEAPVAAAAIDERALVRRALAHALRLRGKGLEARHQPPLLAVVGLGALLLKVLEVVRLRALDLVLRGARARGVEGSRIVF
eukprot:7377521-Prymnesium_polylepis.1